MTAPKAAKTNSTLTDQVAELKEEVTALKKKVELIEQQRDHLNAVLAKYKQSAAHITKLAAQMI